MSQVEKCREMIIAHARKIVYNGNTESAKKENIERYSYFIIFQGRMDEGGVVQ